MTETEIKQMLAQGERLTLECKKAKTELPKIVMPKLTFDLPHPFHMEGYQRVDQHTTNEDCKRRIYQFDYSL